MVRGGWRESAGIRAGFGWDHLGNGPPGGRAGVRPRLPGGIGAVARGQKRKDAKPEGRGPLQEKTQDIDARGPKITIWCVKSFVMMRKILRKLRGYPAIPGKSQKKPLPPR